MRVAVSPLTISGHSKFKKKIEKNRMFDFTQINVACAIQSVHTEIAVAIGEGNGEFWVSLEINPTIVYCRNVESTSVRQFSSRILRASGIGWVNQVVNSMLKSI
jgi:hypothetical protein